MSGSPRASILAAWLEAECAHNPKLRQALGNVWCAGDVSDATLARLDAAAGVPLERPRPREALPPDVAAALDEFEALRTSLESDLSSITPESLSSGSGFPMGKLERMAELMIRLAEYGERRGG